VQRNRTNQMVPPAKGWDGYFLFQCHVCSSREESCCCRLFIIGAVGVLDEQRLVPRQEDGFSSHLYLIKLLRLFAGIAEQLSRCNWEGSWTWSGCSLEFGRAVRRRAPKLWMRLLLERKSCYQATRSLWKYPDAWMCGDAMVILDFSCEHRHGVRRWGSGRSQSRTQTASARAWRRKLSIREWRNARR